MRQTMRKRKFNQAYKISGKLRAIIILPMIIGIAFALLALGIFFVNKNAGYIMFIFTLAYTVISFFLLLYFRQGMLHELVEFASNYSQVQRRLLYDFSVPYCLFDNSGKVMWMNEQMQIITGKKKDFCKNIYTIFPELTVDAFPQDEDPIEVKLKYNNRDYMAEVKKIIIDDITKGQPIEDSDEKNAFIAMYLFDNTDLNMYIQKLKDERFVVGLIYIDNYEEALESIDDVRRSLFIGLIDKRVNKYFSGGAAIVRKMEKDKYLVVFRYKFLDKIIADKFSLLEDIKNVKVGEEKKITLSIGIGTGAGDYAKNYDVSKAAMDLALGRGGDQAVVKDGDKITYFGGKSQQMEKNTRVKVRVKAHALRQILETTDNIMIMGHKIADIDSFGSAMGIYVICRRLEKEAHIVINDVTTSVKPFMDRFVNKPEYPKDLFILREDAVEYVNSQTVVIVVDTNKPSLTECPDLLESCKTIVVFDHHRQSADSIKGAVLSYVDPYASSASEMITEMIQYVEDDVKIKAYEADALYAGINIDTDGFHNKSGPRTFEAAAFLRRHGADVTRVRKMLRNDMTEYVAVAKAVSRATVYNDAFAITVFNGAGLSSPTIGGAKAANQLLDISGIKASFVVTAYNDIIYVSARSIDEVNVQLVMEKLGGGGHMTIAGAQLQNCSTQQAVQAIKNVLDKMIEEGDL